MRTRTAITAPFLAAAFALATLSGCASTPIASSEQAAGADVRAFSTFAFFEPLAMERDGYGTLAGERARAVLRAEMESRGYRLDPENPALRINLIAGAAERPRNAPQVSLGLGLGFGGGNTHGGLGIGLPIGGSKRDASRMPAGIAVDLVDERARRVVWTGSVDLERVGRKGEAAALETALRRVMAGLPPRVAEAR